MKYCYLERCLDEATMVLGPEADRDGIERPVCAGHYHCVMFMKGSLLDDRIEKLLELIERAVTPASEGQP